MSGGKCVVLKGFGGYEMLNTEERPDPKITLSNEVKVQVHACGVNFADIYQRQGMLVDMPKPPVVLGLECSGVVECVGNEVLSLKKGDKVMCYSSKGGLYSEKVVLPAEKCFLMPSSMTFEEGAAFLINYLTAYFTLFDIGNLQRGQTVFVHAIAGGVGCAVTQLSKSMPEITVLGTASDGKALAARANGADTVLSYSSFHEELNTRHPKGVDIFIDNLSGAEFIKSLVHIRGLGKLIHIGANSVITGEKRNFMALVRAFWGLKNVSILQLVNNNQAVCGFHLANLWETDQLRVTNTVEKLCRLYEDGVLKPQIDTTWHFNEVTTAMQRIGRRDNIGKVVITPE
uniref:Enoyl reductase (ER) domain-containing protein n=1 Tax=Strigamia maritima TaxID=126957 RepID=T1JJC6_STRMM